MATAVLHQPQDNSQSSPQILKSPPKLSQPSQNALQREQEAKEAFDKANTLKKEQNTTNATPQNNTPNDPNTTPNTTQNATNTNNTKNTSNTANNVATNNSSNQRRGKHNLRVLGLGFQRCGSYSLKYALDELGFTCFHPIQMIEYTVEKGKWHDTAEWRWWVEFEKQRSKDPNYPSTVDYDEYFNSLEINYDALLDWPFCFYWKELSDYYPNCKCILLIRNKSKWYKSFMTLYKPFLQNRLLKEIIKVFEPRAGWMGTFALVCLSQLGINSFEELKFANHQTRLFEGFDKRQLDIEDYFETQTIEKKEKKSKEDSKGFDGSRLLIYNMIEGFDNDYDKWSALCKFLNVPLPIDENTGKIKKFPHKNQKKFLTTAMNTMQWWILRPTIIIAVCIVLIAVLWKFLF